MAIDEHGLNVSTRLFRTHLCTIWLDIVKEQHYNGKEKSTEKVEATPPSTRHLDSLGQHISEWLGKLNRAQHNNNSDAFNYNMLHCNNLTHLVSPKTDDKYQYREKNYQNDTNYGKNRNTKMR